MKEKSNLPKEAWFRTDRFVVFVYALVAIMCAGQFAIMFWAEIF